MQKLSTRFKTWLWIAFLFAVATIIQAIIGVNIETALQEAQADRFLVDGPPEHWGLKLDSALEYGAIIWAFMVGPFGLGFVLAGFLFSIPDFPAFANWVRNRRFRKAKKSQPSTAGKMESADTFIGCIARLQEVLTGYHESIDRIGALDEANQRCAMIELSDSSIWADRALKQARRDFLNRCSIVMSYLRDGFPSAIEEQQSKGEVTETGDKLIKILKEGAWAL